MYTRMRVFLPASVHVHVMFCVCARTRMCMCVHLFLCGCFYIVYMYSCEYIYVCVHLRACVCACKRMWMCCVPIFRYIVQTTCIHAHLLMYVDVCAMRVTAFVRIYAYVCVCARLRRRMRTCSSTEYQ